MASGRARSRAVSAAIAVALLVSAAVAAAPGGASAGPDRVRVIVQLADPPLASYRDQLPGLDGVLDARTPDGHLRVGARASRAYLGHLEERQDTFSRSLRATAPDADVHWRYRLGFNGFAIEVDRHRLDEIRALPGVVAVTRTYELEFELDESPQLLDLNELWQALPASPLGAGEGRRVALIDSGVNPSHPFFDDTGYTAPPGYPKSQRVSGGQRTNLPLATFASNKVIVGNVYTPPGDSSANPFGPGSIHGTHVAGIMAGIRGNYAYNSGPAVFELPFSGMAPGAYVMSYKLDGDTAEFLAAIEDVIADRADALNISLGHSRWLTTDVENDHVRRALDGAVDAGVVVAASAGNAGANGDSNVTGSWKMSPKVITVASSSHGRVFTNPVSVTGPGSPPDSLRDRVAVPGAAPAPPISTTISGNYVVAPGGDGPDAGQACSSLPAGSMAGRIALVARGSCAFDAKKNNVLGAGAIAMIVHNNGADPPIVMGGFTGPTLPAVMVTRTDGRAMVAWAGANSNPTAEIGGPSERLTSGWPDIASSSSSRGPSPLMTIKPDIAAPGASILSSIVDEAGNARPPFFEQLSGTSMATPHVTGLAAAARALHPDWTPAQLKSAIMNTARTEMYLDTESSVPALAKHRGAGRIHPPGLVDPKLTFAPPSVSFGLLPAGQGASAAVTARDMRPSSDKTEISYSVSARSVVGHASVSVTPAASFATGGGRTVTFPVEISTTGAPAGDHEGFLEVTGGGRTYTIPYFVRVQDPAQVKDVLLVDWDRNVPDHRGVYTNALEGLGLSYDVFDGGTSTAANGNPGPTLAQLQNYRAVVLFTGDAFTSWSTAHVGGSFPLQDYLVGGGRLVLVGQDLQSRVLYNQNTGSDFNLTSMAGWINGGVGSPAACADTDADFYVPAPAGELETKFTLLGRSGDVSVGVDGTGADNQNFPNAGRAVSAEDDGNPCISLYNADHIAPHARVLGTYTVTKQNGLAAIRQTDGVATGVAPDPTLENPQPTVKWAAALLHVGAEGVNANRGELTPRSTLGLLVDFVRDRVSVQVSARPAREGTALVATATSSQGEPIVKYRWDFGDGSRIVETSEPTVVHAYERGRYTARVQAIDRLTRSNVATTKVTGKRKP